MKVASDNYRSASSQGIPVVVYGPIFEDQDDFFNSPIETDLSHFKRRCNVIIANRMVDQLANVMGKVQTRDVFGNN